MFTEPMKDALNETSSDDSRVGRTDRWTPRSWVACCVRTMQACQEQRVQAYIAGDACCFSNFQAVADLLNPERYIRAWPMVPAEEVRSSAVELQMPTGETTKRTIKRRLRFVLVQCSCISGGLLSACAAAMSRHIFAMTATTACEKRLLKCQ